MDGEGGWMGMGKGWVCRSGRLEIPDVGARRWDSLSMDRSEGVLLEWEMLGYARMTDSLANSRAETADLDAYPMRWQEMMRLIF